MKLTMKQINDLVKRGVLTKKDLERLRGKKQPATAQLFRPGKKPLDTNMNIA